jgi:peptidoglycan hydrolase-like protein with peptidoglycan-binding domain
MSDPFLRLHDGFAHTSPERESDVRELQAALCEYKPEVVVDGLFGRGTEDAVRACQRACGLPADGVVRPETWQALLEPAAAPYVAERIASGYPLDHPDLSEELEAAARHGGAIEEAAASTGLPPAVIVALGSRESRLGLALAPRGPAGTADFAPRPYRGADRCGSLPADGGGFRRGLLQIDYDAHAFARDGEWREPGANIAFGCRLLTEAKSYLRRRTMLSSRALLRAALAAYNCGAANVLRALRQGADVDFYTARRDYSADVMRRAGFFQAHGWD